MENHITVCGGITPDYVFKIADVAVSRGYSRNLIFLRVGPGQRRAIRKYLSMVASNEILRYESECGSSVDSGIFAGVPYFVDPDMPYDEIRLESLSCVGCIIGKLTGLMEPLGMHELA